MELSLCYCNTCLSYMHYIISLGCNGDNKMQYAFGEYFMTVDHGECFCGDSGKISCHELQSESNTNST